MNKNVIIVLLAITTIASIAYATFQRTEAKKGEQAAIVTQEAADANADQAMKQVTLAQQHVKQMAEELCKNEIEVLREEAEKQKELALMAKSMAEEARMQVLEAQKKSEEQRLKAHAAQKEAEIQREAASKSAGEARKQMVLSQQHAKQMVQAVKEAEEAKKLAEAELEKLKKKN